MSVLFLVSLALAGEGAHLSAYEAIRVALVVDDAAGAASGARALVVEAAGDTPMEARARALADASGLPAARSAFSELSRLVVGRVAEDPASPKVFVYFCPMWSGYAYWLQATPGLANPYMGVSMPACGVQTTLKVAARAAAEKG